MAVKPQHWYYWQGEDLLIRVSVRPRAGADELIGVRAECVSVRVKAIPAGGAANTALVALVARFFAVPRQRVEVVRGHSARTKLVRVRRPVRLPASLGIAPGPG